MEKIYLFCDFCSRPLFNATEESELINPYRTTVDNKAHKTNWPEVNAALPHLCERCAKKFDWLYENIDTQHKLAKSYDELNKKRRKIFNTKG